MTAEFTNENRNRYYGLRVGDIVLPHCVSGDPWIEGQCEVVSLGFMDNNSVIIKTKSGATKWVAEWCKLITKVEDK